VRFMLVLVMVSVLDAMVQALINVIVVQLTLIEIWTTSVFVTKDGREKTAYSTHESVILSVKVVRDQLTRIVTCASIRQHSMVSTCAYATSIGRVTNALCTLDHVIRNVPHVQDHSSPTALSVKPMHISTIQIHALVNYTGKDLTVVCGQAHVIQNV